MPPVAFFWVALGLVALAIWFWIFAPIIRPERIVARLLPRSKPAALPEALVAEASEDARKLASWITTTRPALWEIEDDHCHYHGSPALSFTYPGRYIRPAGLFIGAKDRDMKPEKRLLNSGPDNRLIMQAVQAVQTKLLTERAQREQAARDAVLRKVTAQRKRIMADVERRT